MTVKQAKEKLIAYRQQQRELRKEIDALRRFLRSKGINPDPPAVDLTERNKTIYNRHLDGMSYKEIAEEFKLSAERIKMICRRIEYMNEREARRKQGEG